MGNDQDNIRNKGFWIAEIIRETEHFYQSEMQQEQRASWILGSACVLLGFIISNDVKINISSPIYVVFSEILIAISGIVSIFTINPKIVSALPNSKIITPQNSEISRKVILNKFHIDNKWSAESYKNRIFHHYLIHYKRARLKGIGVVLSSTALLIGFINYLLVSFFY
jgi:hypothetical protein